MAVHALTLKQALQRPRLQGPRLHLRHLLQDAALREAAEGAGSRREAAALMGKAEASAAATSLLLESSAI